MAERLWAGLDRVLQRHAAERAEKTALVVLGRDGDESERLSFAELDRRARAVAAAILDVGARGAPVLILEPSSARFAAAFWGCVHAGAIAVPAPVNTRGQGLQRLIAIARDAQVAALVSSSRILQDVAAPELDHIPRILADELDPGAVLEAPTPARSEDPVLLQYTSGSVGEPKGVIVTAAALSANLQMVCDAMGLDDEAVVFSWLPLFHDMGLIGAMLGAAFAGRPCILSTPLFFMQKPERWLKGMSRYRATYSGAPNFAYEICARRAGRMDLEGVDLSSWRTAFCGAEPVQAATLRRFAQAFEPCGFRPSAWRPCYGLAEASLIVSGGPRGGLRTRPADRPEGAPVVSCGAPAEGLQVRIVGPDRAPLGDGGEGEVWVAGPSVGAGYWRRPRETAETFGARLADGEGPFLRTGDLGVMSDGELFITGRIKDLIIHRGANLHPADLEQAIAACDPALLPAAAAFQLDGGEIVAVQEVEAPLDAARCAEIVQAALLAVGERFGLRLHDVRLVRRRAIPVTTSGKVRRQACRALYLCGALPPLANAAAQASLGEDREL